MKKASGSIPLAEIIAVQAQLPGRLPHCLGDGLLCRENALYRRVREEFLKAGFRFTKREICDYYSYPLMALDEIQAARLLPYKENARWLAKLERAAPGEFTLDDIKAGELQYNYLIHESAHFLAHEAIFGRAKVAKLPKSRRTLLGVMLGEAFANAVECLSAAYADGDIPLFFLEANCHFRPNDRERANLKKALARFGARSTLRALMASFLYGNYLRDSLSKREEAVIVRYLGLGKAKSLKPLFKIGMQLSEEFRTTTTPLHLRKVGFRNVSRLFQADPLQQLLSEPQLHTRFERLIERITKGL